MVSAFGRVAENPRNAREVFHVNLDVQQMFIGSPCDGAASIFVQLPTPAQPDDLSGKIHAIHFIGARARSFKRHL